ncbi:MAG: SMP-30/gluconolactonase/LRE family protein, partial [Candidatus Omnitrophica bacterium]|nr:SMP-30/gluconolactonase/LRE family protein [Candidatus Omnitrophota bacterium]
MMEKLQVVVRENCHLGENPLWNPFDRELYWTDINFKKLYSFSPDQKGYRVICQGEMVGGFTIQTDGSLLLFADGPGIKIWGKGKLIPVIESIT